MNEIDILEKARSVIVAETADDVAVRTGGGDEDQTFPQIIISWDRNRVDDHGANPFDRFKYDSDGNLISKINHHYFQFTLDLEFKSEDEIGVFGLTDSVERAFLPFEDNPDDFHEHSYLWEVGDSRVQNNPVMEPDWYERTSRITFRYLKVVADSDVESLDEIQHKIDSS